MQRKGKLCEFDVEGREGRGHSVPFHAAAACEVSRVTDGDGRSCEGGGGVVAGGDVDGGSERGRRSRI